MALASRPAPTCVMTCSVYEPSLAASVFHSGVLPIPELKAWLRSQGLEIRDEY